MHPLVQKLLYDLDKSYTPQRYQVMANLLHYYAGVNLDPSVKKYVDDYMYYGTDKGLSQGGGFAEDIPQDLKSGTTKPQDIEQLIHWAENIAIERSLERVKRKFNITDPKLLNDLEKSITELYRGQNVQQNVLQLKAILIVERLKRKAPNAFKPFPQELKAQVEQFAHGRMNLQQIMTAIKQHNPNMKDEEIKTVLTKFPILRKMDSPESVKKIAEDEVLGVVHEHFAQEVEFLNNIQRVTMAGDETMFRGISGGAWTPTDIENNWNKIHRAIGVDKSSGLAEHQIKTAWTPIKHPQFGGLIGSRATAASLDLGAAVNYCTQKGQAVEGWVVEVRPKKGQEGVSLARYEARGNPYSEIDLPQVSTKEIYAIHKVSRPQLGSNQYVIAETYLNPNYKHRDFDKKTKPLLVKNAQVSLDQYEFQKHSTGKRVITVTKPNENPLTIDVTKQPGFQSHIGSQAVSNEGFSTKDAIQKKRLQVYGNTNSLHEVRNRTKKAAPETAQAPVKQSDDKTFRDDYFQHALHHFNEHYFTKPYTNTANDKRIYNQKCAVMMKNGRIGVIYGEKSNGPFIQFRDGKSPGRIDLQVANDSPPKTPQSFNPRTGEINHPDVAKYSFRPNHSKEHSTRAAALIPAVVAYHQQFGSNFNKAQYNRMTPDDLGRLQLMMLASVSGRQDETGFNDSNQRYLYKITRIRAAQAYVAYCKQFRQDLYPNTKDGQLKLYRDAVTIESMGFGDFGEAKRKDMMDGIKQAKEQYIKEKNSGRQGLPDEFPDSFLDETTVTKLFPLLNKENFQDIFPTQADNGVFLHAMDATHSLELKRCYPLSPTPPSSYGLLKSTIANSDKSHEAKVAAMALHAYSYGLLVATGNKIYGPVESDSSKFDTIAKMADPEQAFFKKELVTEYTSKFMSYQTENILVGEKALFQDVANVKKPSYMQAASPRAEVRPSNVNPTAVPPEQKVAAVNPQAQNIHPQAAAVQNLAAKPPEQKAEAMPPLPMIRYNFYNQNQGESLVDLSEDLKQLGMDVAVIVRLPAAMRIIHYNSQTQIAQSQLLHSYLGQQSRFQHDEDISPLDFERLSKFVASKNSKLITPHELEVLKTKQKQGQQAAPQQVRPPIANQELKPVNQQKPLAERPANANQGRQMAANKLNIQQELQAKLGNKGNIPQQNENVNILQNQPKMMFAQGKRAELKPNAEGQLKYNYARERDKVRIQTIKSMLLELDSGSVLFCYPFRAVVLTKKPGSLELTEKNVEWLNKKENITADEFNRLKKEVPDLLTPQEVEAKLENVRRRKLNK